MRLQVLIFLELIIVLMLAALSRSESAYGKLVSVFLCCAVGLLIYHQAYSIRDGGHSYMIAFSYKLIGAILVAFYLSVGG